MNHDEIRALCDELEEDNPQGYVDKLMLRSLVNGARQLLQENEAQDKALRYIAFHPMTFDKESPFRCPPPDTIIKDMQAQAKKGLKNDDTDR